jgi:hypothetical protein
LKGGEIGALECPVVARWRVAQLNLRTQLKLLLTALDGMPTQRTAIQLNALTDLMALSISGLVIESLHRPDSTQTLTGPFVHTLQELVRGGVILA